MSLSRNVDKRNQITLADEANMQLLTYKTWEDYLDSFIEANDLRNLLNLRAARKIVGFGFKCQGTLSQEEFERRKGLALEQIRIRDESKIFSVVMGDKRSSYDPLMVALAERELWNRKGIVNSIVFLRKTTKKGFDISGYIDYAHRLAVDNWEPFFRNEKRLWPRLDDLGYYNWKNGIVRSNTTKNYKPLIDVVRGGLLFQNLHDHKIVNPNPETLKILGPGVNTSKQTIRTRKYAQIEIYDHTVRLKR